MFLSVSAARVVLVLCFTYTHLVLCFIHICELVICVRM